MSGTDTRSVCPIELCMSGTDVHYVCPIELCMSGIDISSVSLIMLCFRCAVSGTDVGCAVCRYVVDLELGARALKVKMKPESGTGLRACYAMPGAEIS
eukprot:3463842-Rhodomonas_salina.4